MLQGTRKRYPRRCAPKHELLILRDPPSSTLPSTRCPTSRAGFAPSDDVLRLAGCLVGATGGVALSGEEEAGYRRLTDRVLALFHAGDPLQRFLYRDGA